MKILDLTEKEKARFWSKVAVIQDNCWEWNGAKDRGGYGSFKPKNKTLSSHRISYNIFNHFIPDGKHVLHKCDNPACVNPDHLFLGTHKDNMHDMIKKGRQGKKGASSKYTGVSKRKGSKRWRAMIKINGKTKSLGYFDNEMEAAQTYNKEAMKVYGDEAFLNKFPDTKEED